MDDTLPVIGGANGTVTSLAGGSLAGRPVLVCSPLHTPFRLADADGRHGLDASLRFF
jgi:hypothetical protein